MENLSSVTRGTRIRMDGRIYEIRATGIKYTLLFDVEKETDVHIKNLIKRRGVCYHRVCDVSIDMSGHDDFDDFGYPIKEPDLEPDIFDFNADIIYDSNPIRKIFKRVIRNIRS